MLAAPQPRSSGATAQIATFPSLYSQRLFAVSSPSHGSHPQGAKRQAGLRSDVLPGDLLPTPFNANPSGAGPSEFAPSRAALVRALENEVQLGTLDRSAIAYLRMRDSTIRIHAEGSSRLSEAFKEVVRDLYYYCVPRQIADLLYAYRKVEGISRDVLYRKVAGFTIRDPDLKQERRRRKTEKHRAAQRAAAQASAWRVAQVIEKTVYDSREVQMLADWGEVGHRAWRRGEFFSIADLSKGSSSVWEVLGDLSAGEAIRSGYFRQVTATA
jgi:hypothetical protein